MTWTNLKVTETNDRVLKALPDPNLLNLLNYVFVSNIGNEYA